MTEKEPSKTVAKLKRKRKNKNMLNYILLFVCVFFVCVFAFFSGMKSYTPTANVDIGNDKNMILNDSDLDFEFKSIDERLKWIKMEDDLPTVAVRNSKAEPSAKRYEMDTTIKFELEDGENPVIKPVTSSKTIAEAPRPVINKVPQINNDLKTAQAPKVVVPLPTQTPTYTKVYLGKFSNLEEALSIQKSINADFPQAAAFIKSYENNYIVQLGSFVDRQSAESFMSLLRNKGYNPKVL